MFTYPPQALFDRVIPKSKIYAHAKPGKAVKALFVASIGEIVWKYKLSPETINLPARHGVFEIQVFDLSLKTLDLHPSVLRTIDRAIPFPILFQLPHGDRIRFAASWKRPSEADAAKWVIEASFLTPWQSVSSERPPLPVALDLASLYEQLIRRHLPLPPRPGEGLEVKSRIFRVMIRSARSASLGFRGSGFTQWRPPIHRPPPFLDLHGV